MEALISWSGREARGLIGSLARLIQPLRQADAQTPMIRRKSAVTLKLAVDVHLQGLKELQQRVHLFGSQFEESIHARLRLPSMLHDRRR